MRKKMTSKFNLLHNFTLSVLIILLAMGMFRYFPFNSNFESDPIDSLIEENELGNIIPTESQALGQQVEFTDKPRTFHLPVQKDSVLFFTAASSGPAQEAAMQLSSHGYQVVIGTKSAVDKQAFSYYGLKKGIELIDFDLFDPSTFPDLIYRLRVIERDLKRYTNALVINMIDYLEELKKELPGKTQINLLDIKEVDEFYKISMKSPIRILQAMMELARLQTIEKNQKMQSVEKDEIDGFDEDDTKPLSSEKGWDAGGFRIVLLIKQFPDTACSSLDCVFQKALIDYLDLLLSSSTAQQFSISVIPVKEKNIIPDEYRNIDWTLDLSMEEIEEGVSGEAQPRVSHQTSSRDIEASKTIVHSVMSTSPLYHYPTSFSSASSSSTSSLKTALPHLLAKEKKSSNTPVSLKSPPKKAPAKGAPKRGPTSSNPYEQFARKKGGRSSSSSSSKFQKSKRGYPNRKM